MFLVRSQETTDLHGHSVDMSHVHVCSSSHVPQAGLSAHNPGCVSKSSLGKETKAHMDLRKQKTGL